MNNPNIQAFLERHESFLHKVVQRANIPAPRIKEAMQYALFPGGKRLRPMLVYLSGQLIDVSIEALDIIAVAIELTHCYSLIHDDLPAMDNDDFRRGKPSCHRAFDEATAILVGDGLQALAIEILLTELPNLISLEKTISITQALVHSSGPSGMVSGQSLDLTELNSKNVDEPQIRQIHQLKTGQLILTCINMVLICGNPSPEVTSALRQFAEHLGLAFQMQDDYLDCYGHQTTLGKDRASDAANKKITYATLFSQQELLEKTNALYKQAELDLFYFSDKSRCLLNLVHKLKNTLIL